MMSHALYRWGRLAVRHPWRVIGAWLLLVVVVVAASGAFGKKLEDSFAVPGADSQQATELLTKTASARAGLTMQLVLTPRDPGTTFASPEARAALSGVRAGAAALPNVLDAGPPTVSPDGRVALIEVQYPVVERLDRSDLQRMEEYGARAAAGSPLRVEMRGDLFFAFAEAETGIGEVLGLVAAIVILLVAFGSVVAMGLPIGMAVLGLTLGIGSLSLIAYLVEIPSWAPVLGSMVGLGVGIDYALFVVTRHREHLALGMEVEESVGRALATAGKAVVFAGGTVVIAILGLAVAGIPFMTAGGIAISVIVLIMVSASITVLPALLGVAGPWVNRLGLHRPNHPDRVPGTRWVRWGNHVARHAKTYAVAVPVLLLAAAAPVLSMHVGGADDGALPQSRTERRAYDLVADGFGPGANGPLVIAMDISQDSGVVDSLQEAVASDAGIEAVAAPQVDARAGVATVVAFPTTGPQDGATWTTIERLRSQVLPDALAHSPAQAHVGGQTATFADAGDRVHRRLPVFVSVVVLMSFLLLTVLFRSLLVPLKAAAMNLLSIGAAYGVLVMVFQWGWGAGLIGLESTVPIVSFIPMFMFAILFGLSMDYEVFLLSRIREEYLESGDNADAVIRGIAGTGRVITSAALIMISVFLGFVLSDDPTTKMFGLGLATAILVDATLVRMVLVPATMTLLGDLNWWLPDGSTRSCPGTSRW